MTIIHSSTTETVRLPADGGSQNVTVHPAAVRSKLPMKKRVREKRNVNNNNNNSPTKKSRKKVPVEEESTTETSSPKKVPQAQKKERKMRRKKSKGVIDYSVAQNKVLIANKKPQEDDPLGKVRNWLLNSHHIEALGTLRKSKSSPAGFAEPPKPVPPKAAQQQKTKDNQVSLQVVYKPPFKFSVKLSKSKPDLSKDKRPERIKQRAALLIRANRAHGGAKQVKKLNNRTPQEPKGAAAAAAAKEEPIYENAAIDLLRMSSTEHDGHQPIFPVAASPPKKQRKSFAGVDAKTEETKSKRNSVPQQFLQPSSSSGTNNNLMRFPSTENKTTDPTYANVNKSDENRKDEKS